MPVESWQGLPGCMSRKNHKHLTGDAVRSKLGGKIAVVTGASRGIGLAIAEGLAAHGCSLVVTGRNGTILRREARRLERSGAKILSAVCDVRDEKSIAALIAEVKSHFGRIDILVNNAGISHASAPAGKLSHALWRDVIETNLTGLFLVSQAALPLMGQGSVIVNNLSVAAKVAFTGSSAYNASKHGGLGFTNTLREELREQGIRVIALLAGATETEIWNTMWPEAPREKMMSAEAVAQALIGVLLVPDDGTVEELTIRPAAGSL
jgi:NAD(P)-dependent dehydrogenase (short-subunit alcohol dehydrogenase family)